MNEVLALVRHKLDVDAYYRMAEAGIFGKHDRIELIIGELIDMAPIGTSHAAMVDGIAQALILACRDRAIVRVQNPVRLDGWSELQPDFAVLRLRADRYMTEHPAPSDVLLLIEVADSTLRYDRTVKLPLYARAGIAEYWIVDLNARLIDAYRRPVLDGYADHTPHQSGETLALAEAPDIAITLAPLFALLPEPPPG